MDRVQLSSVFPRMSTLCTKVIFCVSTRRRARGHAATIRGAVHARAASRCQSDRFDRRDRDRSLDDVGSRPAYDRARIAAAAPFEERCQGVSCGPDRKGPRSLAQGGSRGHPGQYCHSIAAARVAAAGSRGYSSNNNPRLGGNAGHSPQDASRLKVSAAVENETEISLSTPH